MARSSVSGQQTQHYLKGPSYVHKCLKCLLHVLGQMFKCWQTDTQRDRFTPQILRQGLLMQSS